MFLKLMSSDAAPDHDSRKRFRILDDVTAVDFERADAGAAEGSYPQARVTFRDGKSEYFYLDGNAYVMSDAGKTISSFCREYISGSPCAPESEQNQTPGRATTERGGT